VKANVNDADLGFAPAQQRHPGSGVDHDGATVGRLDLPARRR
jgi:hypothetical protein